MTKFRTERYNIYAHKPVMKGLFTGFRKQLGWGGDIGRDGGEIPDPVNIKISKSHGFKVVLIIYGMGGNEHFLKASQIFATPLIFFRDKK